MRRLNAKQVGDAVRTARLAHGMTQAQLSNRVGISQDWVSHIECGRRLPSFTVGVGLASVLGLDFEWLWCSAKEKKRRTEWADYLAELDGVE